MMEDSYGDPGNFRIRFPGVVELKLGDEWRAFWNDAEQLPPDVPVTQVYALVYRGDRGYVVRPRGSRETWSTVEATPGEGESPEECVVRAVREQAGATSVETRLFGFLECRATMLNRDHAPGARTARAAYVAVAGTMDDLPDDSACERRRMTLSEHAAAIRTRYPELSGHFNRAAQDYAVQIARMSRR